MKLNNPPKLNVPERKPLPQMAQVPTHRSNSSYLPNNTRGIDDPFDDMDEALLNLDVECNFFILF